MVLVLKGPAAAGPFCCSRAHTEVRTYVLSIEDFRTFPVGRGEYPSVPAIAPLARTRPAASLAAYVLFVAIVTAAYAVVSARAAQSWIMGEWLINYQGGFVRRGLPGELILRAARALDRPPIAVALVLAILLYAVFYAGALLLTRGVRWSLPLAMLFLSPATLGFIVLDPPSSVRKEVLLLAAVGLLCLALHRGRVRTVPLALCLALTAAVCVLSHEGLVFFLPYLFAPVFLERASPPRSDNQYPVRRALVICLPALTVGVLAALAVARHPGGPATATAICHSLGANLDGAGHGLCGGAIFYLTHDRDYARQDVLRAARAYHYGLLYSVTGGLAILPAVLLFAQLARERPAQLRILLVATSLSVTGSLVLFSLARDWGRWISIHVTCLLLLLLFVHRAPPALAQQRAQPEPRTRASRAALACVLLLYGACWNLPGTGNYHARWGYFGLVRYLQSYRTSVHPASSSSP